MTAHPEDFCQRCGATNPSWAVDSDRFNLAMAALGFTKAAIVCPACFVEGHEAATLMHCSWTLVPVTPFRPVAAPDSVGGHGARLVGDVRVHPEHPGPVDFTPDLDLLTTDERGGEPTYRPSTKRPYVVRRVGRRWHVEDLSGRVSGCTLAKCRREEDATRIERALNATSVEAWR